MKKIKRIFVGVIAFILLITVASCKGKEKPRNQEIPYGNLDLNQVIAESKDKGITLNLGTYYSRIRAKGYDLFLELLKKELYKNEYNALNKLIQSNSVNDLSDAELKTLSFEENQKISEQRYNEIKERTVERMSTNLLNSIFNSTDPFTIESMKEKDKDIAITKFIESMARKGYTLTKEQIVYSKNENETMILDLTKLPQQVYDSELLSRAEDFYAQKELYKIAGLEYLNEGTDDEEKNDNYLFSEDSISSSYDSSYKTFGTYKAIIITFNSRREAQQAMNALGHEITENNVEQSYLDLYNTYYSCYGVQTLDSDKFDFTVSLKKNELNDISSSVNTLITETLEDGEFLTEPRNLNNKYVLAYRISTTYDYEEKEFEELDQTTKNALTNDIKVNLVQANSSSYVSTAFNEALEKNTIEIYDPSFEYHFRTSYTDYYDLISTKNENIGKDILFRFNDTLYKVEDFYTMASTRLGASIITEYFQQEYVLKYEDEFVTESTNKANTEELDKAIKTFNQNKNQTYPKAIGLKTYLLNAYGYETKDDVIKYYYKAASCLSSYKAKVMFDEWATDEHGISDDAMRILQKILQVGNKTYETLFELNVDHILINIDYNADGTPDDPEQFISENNIDVNDFETEITKLAQAIYQEAIYEDYKDNDLYATLAYIVKQYNKGEELRSQPGVTWDTFKQKYNFLLTAEQLAADSDITQDSVSNFVTPFADYLKDMYKKATSDDTEIDEHGNFFTVEDGKLTKPEEAASITANTLCKTVYGYHLIVLNEYDGPESLRFTKESNDSNGYQEKIQVLLHEDEDDETKNIYVELSSYNEFPEEANINQLFIYYVQTKNGDQSSLDSNISELLSSMFTTAINAYSSSNFQTVLLLDEIHITSSNETISNLIQTERNYYANLVINYDEEKTTLKYYDEQSGNYQLWTDPNMNSAWERPNQK